MSIFWGLRKAANTAPYIALAAGRLLARRSSGPTANALPLYAML